MLCSNIVFDQNILMVSLAVDGFKFYNFDVSKFSALYNSRVFLDFWYINIPSSQVPYQNYPLPLIWHNDLNFHETPLQYLAILISSQASTTE